MGLVKRLLQRLMPDTHGWPQQRLQVLSEDSVESAVEDHLVQGRPNWTAVRDLWPTRRPGISRRYLRRAPWAVGLGELHAPSRVLTPKVSA